MGKIEWCDRSDWNPIRGCTRLSEGCRYCYAEQIAARFSGPGQPFAGYARRSPARWTGRIGMAPDHLTLPLRWKRPALIFALSMSDLFHEQLRPEDIDRVHAVMAAASRHRFIVLTKRASIMAAYLRGLVAGQTRIENAARSIGHTFEFQGRSLLQWPLPNVAYGISVEDQETFEERWPHLRDAPAARRIISYEPALGLIDFDHAFRDASRGPFPNQIIMGGESGPRSRRFDIGWARKARDACMRADVPFFLKQLGAKPERSYPQNNAAATYTREPIRLKNRKGTDMAEWPEDLRVREAMR